jgi:hypothetical protein
MTADYRPRHRTQLQRPVTGKVDCGPRSWQHAIDNATRGRRDPGVDYLRRLGGRPGAQPTNVYNADQAFGQLGLVYQRKVGASWLEAIEALRSGRGVHLCIAYGVLNDLQPARSGDPNFSGGHSIYVEGLRRRRQDDRRVVLSFDSLYDGRRASIPEGPRWVLLGTLRRASQAFAGRADTFWGGIIPPNRDTSGPGEDELPDVDDLAPIDPDDTADEGEQPPPGSTLEDLEQRADLDPDDEGEDAEQVDDA